MNILRRIKRIQSGWCFYCENVRMTKRTITKDHFYPKCRNNSLFDNQVLCCLECNRAKADRKPTKKEVEKFERLGLNTVHSRYANIQKKERACLT